MFENWWIFIFIKNDVHEILPLNIQQLIASKMLNPSSKSTFAWEERFSKIGKDGESCSVVSSGYATNILT